MKILRSMKMNEKDNTIVENMVKYIEEKERTILAAELGKIKNPKKVKNKAVNEILKELERLMKNEN